MRNNVFVALDFSTMEEALQFLSKNKMDGVPVKVGMELFYKEGPLIIEILKEKGHPIFLDLKLFDIPNTVHKSMVQIAGLGVDMVTVHALGGSEMMLRAKEGLLEGAAIETKLLAVTILTSMNEEKMNKEMYIDGLLERRVTDFAVSAKSSFADGVICSVLEAEQIKKVCGDQFLTVTPGIRLGDNTADDQKRIATPKAARKAGADILVVGRSITKAENPKSVFEQIVKEISSDEHGTENHAPFSRD